MKVSTRIVSSWSIGMAGAGTGVLAVPPLSCTRKLMLNDWLLEFLSSDGVNTKLAVLMSIGEPTVIGMPLLVRVPLVGAEVMITFLKPFGVGSLESENP